MTISSSLNAGVAGLSANASRLASISDNIANSATYGYKRASTEFHSMVVNGESSARYVASGVTTSSLRLIDEKGALTRTDNATDLAVDGRGFLPVTQMETLGDGDRVTSMALVTTGSFRVDASGYLKTNSGQVLLGWPANAAGQIGLNARDTVTGLEPVKLNSTALSANATTAASLSLNLPATGTRFDADGTGHEIAMEYFDNMGNSQRLTFTFTPTVPAAGSSNEWTLEVADSASGVTVGEYELAFNDAPGIGGTLMSVTTVSGPAYSASDGSIALALPHGPLTLSIGVPGQAGGLTQLSSTFIPSAPVKNGSPVASMVSVEVDAKGNLYGVFDQGFSRLLYQIPVADVRNPNGLTAIGDQAYQVSSESGEFYLWDGGQGPTGGVKSFMREESSTDIARELTQLIQTQRAYSSNAKVIQTVDEMYQETTNLKR